MPTIYSLSPYLGPVTGGTKVQATGDDFSKHCNLTMRFGTTKVWGNLTENGIVTNLKIDTDEFAMSDLKKNMLVSYSPNKLGFF